MEDINEQIKNDNIHTPPSNKVLLGVTRMHVIHICREKGWEIREAVLQQTKQIMTKQQLIRGGDHG